MKTIIYHTILILLITQSLISQSSLFIPLDIKKTYENGTRSYDGNPGPNYWQNHSEYKIKASLEPKLRQLKGEEKITYYNESPDTLRQIVFRLYQDIYKPGNAHDWDIPEKEITEGIILEKLVIENNNIDLNNKDLVRRGATNLTIELQNPILPKSKVSIESNWYFTIPGRGNMRMGTYDSTTYYIAYWYPQISVYDDIHGWDEISYKGVLEFYNDFSDFDVEITAPNTFCTWATGILQNPEYIMTSDTYSRYKQALSSKDVINIISTEDIKNNNLFVKTSDVLTWHYRAENVTDFAFGISDHYLWDGVSSEVEPGRITFISAAYNPQSKDFYEVAGLSKKIIESYSKDFPGVPYPYPKMTVFNGGGGMEYPMMVNESSSDELSGTVYVTSHEIAHTYFPFYMGTNERRWAWMDEGWAQALSFDIQIALAPERDTRAFNVTRYLGSAGKEEDMPMMVPSDDLGRFRSYRSTSYLRPGEAYDMLRNTLGDENFIKSLHEYMKRWHGKHPMPYDFFFTLDNVGGQDLSWFWKPWFFEFGYPDLSIKDVITEKGTTKIFIEKVGNIPIPISLEVTYEDSTKQEIFRIANEWKSGEKIVTIELSSNKNIKSILLGNSHTPDVDYKNNLWIK